MNPPPTPDDDSPDQRPGAARLLLITLVAWAAMPWNRLRHPERFR